MGLPVAPRRSGTSQCPCSQSDACCPLRAAQDRSCRSSRSRQRGRTLSLLTLFKNKQEAQKKAIKDELANIVDEELFDKAYEYATRDKYRSLTVDFNPKCSSKVFRKDLNQVIIFDELRWQYALF